MSDVTSPHSNLEDGALPPMGTTPRVHLVSFSKLRRECGQVQSFGPPACSEAGLKCGLPGYKSKGPVSEAGLLVKFSLLA